VLAALLCLAIALLYNVARTGSAFGTGYGRQATPAAFSTPLLVGLYGLLLSSGKGVLWFAPLTALVPAAVPAAWRRLGAPALGIALACAAMTCVYASFEHWAGDGSWGPRYLVPLIPLALVLVVAAHAQQPWGGRLRMAVVGTLAALGFVVQLGGAGIYFGAQMREAGDYPYMRALNDPLFMAESHFNPSYSPIGQHWRMLVRNTALFVRGEGPTLSPVAAADPVVPSTSPRAGAVSTVETERLAVPEREIPGLTRALDVWWAYAIAAGLPRLPILVVAFVVFLAALLQFAHTVQGVRLLEVRPLDPAPDHWRA